MFHGFFQFGTFSSVRWVKVLIASLGILLIMLFSYLLGAKSGVEAPTLTLYNNTQINSSQIAWKTYTNKTYGYSFDYPSNWTINTTYAEVNLTKDSSQYFGTEEDPRISDVTLTHNGYVFEFKYGPANYKPFSSIYKSMQKVYIDNQMLYKLTDAKCYVPSSQMNSCLNRVNGFSVTDPSHIGNNSADILFHSKDNNVSISLIAPRGSAYLTEGTSEFFYYDDVFNNILLSTHLP